MKKFFLSIIILLSFTTLSFAETLTWEDLSSTEDEFIIYILNPSDTSYTELGRVPTDTTTFAITVPEDDQLYCYKVTASNAAGESGASRAACLRKRLVTETIACPATPDSCTIDGGANITPN